MPFVAPEILKGERPAPCADLLGAWRWGERRAGLRVTWYDMGILMPWDPVEVQRHSFWDHRGEGHVK